MTELSIDEKYAKEVAQAEIDHHTPTAGAMLGHVLSNLFMEKVLLTQAGLYAKDPIERGHFRAIAAKEDEWFYKIADLLLDEGEVVPTTTEEFIRYHKFITENPKRKYWRDEAIFESLINDFQNQNLFITRAIKLAQKEDKFAVAAAVTDLYGYNLEVIRHLAGDLGKTPADFKDEDEDDDD